MVQFFLPIADVVVFDKVTAEETCTDGLYQISSALIPNHGDHSTVPLGMYLLKVRQEQ